METGTGSNDDQTSAFKDLDDLHLFSVSKRGVDKSLGAFDDSLGPIRINLLQGG